MYFNLVFFLCIYTLTINLNCLLNRSSAEYVSANIKRKNILGIRGVVKYNIVALDENNV